MRLQMPGDAAVNCGLAGFARFGDVAADRNMGWRSRSASTVHSHLQIVFLSHIRGVQSRSDNVHNHPRAGWLYNYIRSLFEKIDDDRVIRPAEENQPRDLA
jgi:hypothetical protein